MDELFAATNTQHVPLSMHRLGSKKNRPIILVLSIPDKEEFMSELWMLKNIQQMKFKNIDNA